MEGKFCAQLCLPWWLRIFKIIMENAASLQGQAMGEKGIAREHLSVLVGQASRKDEESSYGRIQA